MYVCLCNGVTDHDIRHAAMAGCKSMAELTMRTGCGATCGSCVPMAKALLVESRATCTGPVSDPALPLRAIAHAA